GQPPVRDAARVHELAPLDTIRPAFEHLHLQPVGAQVVEAVADVVVVEPFPGRAARIAAREPVQGERGSFGRHVQSRSRRSALRPTRWRVFSSTCFTMMAAYSA